MVVVSILALLAVAIPRLGGSGLPAGEETARKMLGELRAARAEAIGAGAPVAVSFDLAARRFGREGREAALPEGVELTLRTGLEAADRRGRARIVFFPDGSATGGTLRLEGRGPATVLTVRWLTGAVRRS